MKKTTFSFVFLGLLAIVPFTSQASNCAPGDLFDSNTGARCVASSVIPGCLPGYNFSPITGQKCPITIDPITCYAYANLTIGSTGAQVIELQTRLVADGYLVMPYGVAKGYFGNLTAQAVARARFNGLYPCNVGVNQAPVISGVSGPTTLNVDQTGTWTVSARDPENGSLSYSVNWGDTTVIDPCPNCLYPNQGSAAQNTSSFTHVYSRVGNFTPMFIVRDNTNQEARSSVSVNVGGTVSNQPTVKVVSPNGGENWLDHSIANIVWDPIGCAGCQYFARYNPAVDIYLNPVYPACDPASPCPMYPYHAPFVLDRNVSRSNSSYGWIVATDINDVALPAGKYKVQVCVAGSTTDCDTSDNYFTIFQAQAY